ncbi:MAG: hypothetical protein EXR93_01570 [Gemmatimonadetes bacterium]|nr:hypothetical protein [Gemmatimonadota bacterium]
MSTRVGVVGLMAAFASPLAAQQPAANPASPSAGISGFLAMNWGATGKDVLNAYGEPLMDQVMPDSVRVIVYKDNVLAKSVLALFYLDRAKGLVKGVYSASYGDGSDCETVFQKFRTFVQRLNPSIKPQETRRHDDPTVAFCDAAAAGKAAWSTVWTEPLTGNSVHLTLEPEEKHVEVAYQTRAFKPVTQ